MDRSLFLNNQEGIHSESRGISAKRSLFIFFLYYIVQFLTGLIVGVIISLGFILITGHRPSEEQFELFARSVDPYVLLGSSVISGLFLVYITLNYTSGLVKDRSVYGFAVHTGKMWQIVEGFAAGFITAFLYAFITNNLVPHSHENSFGPVTQMVISGGIPKYTWLILALLVAPIIEEYLFRGILFAGFARSAGTKYAVVITTGIFLIVHIAEYLYYPPAMTGILAIGLLAIYLRIKTKALGPCIAAHAGYNLFITLILFNAVG